MRILGYNWESLRRHGVTAAMIDEVLTGSMVSVFEVEDATDTCEMLVGYTFGERLLEVGVRYVEPGAVFIFHAQAVSPAFKRKFEEEWDLG